MFDCLHCSCVSVPVFPPTQYTRLFLAANRAPQFAATMPVTIHAVVNNASVVPIDIIGPDDTTPGMTVTASVINSAGLEQLSQPKLDVVRSHSGDNFHYKSSLTWSPNTRDMYTLKVVATDQSGASSVMTIAIVLCACHDPETCDYSETWVSPLLSYLFTMKIYKQLVCDVFVFKLLFPA